MIKVINSSLKGVKKIVPNLYHDNRGKFYEGWNEKIYKEITGGLKFCQDNISESKKNVIRGLHYQYPNFQQGKLVFVLYGEILDVVVDIRKNSPTYKKWDSYILEEKQNHQLWIPPGFAHGFCVTSDLAVVQYKCTATYSKTDEKIIRWDDPSLNILWPTSKPILSVKDKSAPYLNNQIRLPQYEDR